MRNLTLPFLFALQSLSVGGLLASRTSAGSVRNELLKFIDVVMKRAPCIAGRGTTTVSASRSGPNPKIAPIMENALCAVQTTRILRPSAQNPDIKIASL